jgi:hypothetical protein
MSSELLTPTAWGRRVDLSRQAAHSAVRRLGIPLVDGKVDSVVATTIYRTKGRPQVRHRRSVQIVGKVREQIEATSEIPKLTKQPDEGDLHDWRTRQARADALEREHDLAVKRGKYIPTELVLREWEVILSTLRTNLLNLGARIAPLVAGRPTTNEVQAIVDDLVWHLLDDLSRNDDLYDQTRRATQRP